MGSKNTNQDAKYRPGYPQTSTSGVPANDPAAKLRYPVVGSWWRLKSDRHRYRWQVKKVVDGGVYLAREGRPFFVDESSMFLNEWNRLAVCESDTDGDGDCHLCAGRPSGCLQTTPVSGHETAQNADGCDRLADKWIRVRDQEPPEGQLVLAELGLEHVIGRRQGDYFELRDWTARLSHVGYWMPVPPIPDPYDG